MVHLHVRSSYTLLSSTLKIKDIVDYTKQHEMNCIALVDERVMHGSMAFYEACKKEGIKPIFGMQCTCKIKELNFDFILYAKNNNGFKRLLQLSSLLNTTLDILDYDMLRQFKDDIILTTAGTHDELFGYLCREEFQAIELLFNQIKNDFAYFYVAIAMNDSGFVYKRNAFLKRICDALSIQTFALSRIYCKTQEDELAYQTLCAIAQQKTLDDKTLDYSSKRYFRSEAEMKELYEPQDLLHTQEIADLCEVNLDFKKASLPMFKNKYGVDSNTYLRNLCKQGLMKRMHNQVNEQYTKRLAFELDVIMSMGFADYFLIVYDFIRYAKSEGIYVGPGRGSVAGSLVSYCLGITQVDPIAYHLLFERFLNPERISMPDIDIDFPDNRRDEVIRYVTNKYGKKHVAHIATFGTLGAKQVLRDVGRVLGISNREIDLLTKLVPNMPKVTLTATYANFSRFKSVVEASKKFQQLYALAIQLEGLERHISTHAAGIVLSNVNIDEVCPLIEVESDLYSTQYTMEYLEQLGLIKIDFLGLRNLTIIDQVTKSIPHPIVIQNIDLQDKKTLALLREVDTMGVFQLESEGMKNLLRKLQVRNFEEVVAAIALFRPGPMENIPLYLENRQSISKIQYLHEDLKPILEPTYGIMIYQEQIMQVSQVMAGFSLAKADILRKAMSKKIEKEIVALRQDFITGAVEKGYKKALAIEVYELIEKFANYGFNRSHSVAYGMIAFQLAYLKANYPLYFFSSLLNSVIGSEYKTSEYIFEAKKRGIVVLHPSVNTSHTSYRIEERSIRFPLLNIKNVGIAACQIIIDERNKNGAYKNYFDFIARISLHRISRKIIESLVDAGALDDFGFNRLSMKVSLDDALRYASLVSIEQNGQTSINLDLVSCPAMTIMKERLMQVCENEKNVLGFYLRAHPIQSVRQNMGHAQSLIELKTGNMNARFVCIVDRIKEHKTKTNEWMAFLNVSDDTSKFDVVVMPNLYRTLQARLKRGNYIVVQGKIDKVTSCLARQIEIITME